MKMEKIKYRENYLKKIDPFMGTSLIIIVSVVLETAKSIESKMVAREYESIF